jgi:hypothetical protein
MQSLFEKNGGTYRQESGYLIPNLEVPKPSGRIGKYGRLHKKFLKQIYPAYYSTLRMSGKLFDYLQEIDSKAKNELDRLILLLAEKQGVTEKSKADNQFEWIGLMNNIKAQAEEIIYSEIVYVKGA